MIWIVISFCRKCQGAGCTIPVHAGNALHAACKKFCHAMHLAEAKRAACLIAERELCVMLQVPELQMPRGKPEAPAPPKPQSSLGRAPAAATPPIPDLVMPRGKQLSPSAGATALKVPAAEPAAPRRDPGPPPPLTKPRGRLGVSQAARLAQELDALRQGAPNVSAATPAPAVEVRDLARCLSSILTRDASIAILAG